MAAIEIQRLTGEAERQDVSRTQPVSIGRHASSDICIDEPDVPVLCCRIGWNRKAYEVTAASPAGVELNGTMVRNAVLKSGDVIRVGTVDLVFRRGRRRTEDREASPRGAPRQAASQGAAARDDEITLKPLTEELAQQSPGGGREKPPGWTSSSLAATLAREEEHDRLARDAKRKARSERSEPGSKAPGRAAAEQDLLDDPLLDDDFEPAGRRGGRRIAGDDEDDSGGKPDSLSDPLAGIEDDDVLGDEPPARRTALDDLLDDDEDEDAPAPSLAGRDGDDVAGQPMLSRATRFAGDGGPAGDDAPRAPLSERLQQIKTTLKGRPVRPGERDVVRSPFVLSLGGGTLALLLTAAVIWFMIGRQTSSRLYDAAAAELAERNYSQAIQLFEDFLMRYPTHRLTDPARLGLGKATIESRISGATPDWKEGLDELRKFTQEHRDRPWFKDQRDLLRRYSQQIAFGAARTAAEARRRDLLEVVNDARSELIRHFPPDEPFEKVDAELAAARKRAEDAIIKQETFDAAIAGMEAALEARDPMEALKGRQRLLERYSEFSRHRRVAELLRSTLETEKSLAVREDVQRDAVREERSTPLPLPLTPTPHARSRSEEVSEGRVAVAVAKGACYGIDTVTGEPVWRREVGVDSPFFPMDVATSTPGLLLFDTHHQELVAVERKTGRLIWRQALEERPGGPPLVHGGHIYLPALDRRLYKIDVETGRISAALAFSQKVMAPPALVAGGERLVVAGDAEVLYSVSLRRLECEGVAYTEHRAGAIEAPLLAMGHLLLMAENDQARRCRLNVLDARDPDQGLPRVAQSRVEGHVRDVPVLWGRQLFVPSSGERIAVFTVSDDPNQAPLTRVAAFQLQDAASDSSYLYAGPDGQFWMATNALRKLQLKTGSVQLDPKQATEGHSTQPLQPMGRYLYVGRRVPWNDAVHFSRVERDQMAGDWRVTLGARHIAWTARGDSLVCVGENGEVFRVSADELARGGFKRSPLTPFRLPETLIDPLRATALPDGRLAVAAGAPEPRMWILNANAQVERQITIDEPLEADPVLVGDVLVLPLPGRLRPVGRTASAAEDFLAPAEREEKSRWSFLAAIDETHLAAVDSRGRLSRLQFRTSPVPHLFELSQLELGEPVDVPLAVGDGTLFVATGHRVQVLDASSFGVLAEIPFDAPVTNAPWVVGGRLFVETGSRALHSIDTSEWQPAWSVDLAASASGAPVEFEEQLIVAQRNGEVLAVDPASGNVASRLELSQPIDPGPRLLGTALVIPAFDGSLYRLDSMTGAAAPVEEAAE